MSLEALTKVFDALRKMQNEVLEKFSLEDDQYVEKFIDSVPTPQWENWVHRFRTEIAAYIKLPKYELERRKSWKILHLRARLLYAAHWRLCSADKFLVNFEHRLFLSNPSDFEIVEFLAQLAFKVLK